MKKTVALAAALLLIFTACNSGSKSSKETTDTTVTTNNQPVTADSITDTNATDEVPRDTDIADKVKDIRENFNRINSITKWDSVINKDLFETLEGGEATAYLNNNVLEKISSKQYGESFQVVNEYYLSGGEFSFAYEKFLRYNRPMYYDTATMKELNDTEVFDFSKSKVFETRSYFENNKMIHQVTKYDTSIAEYDAAGNTEKAILEDYNKLLKLFK